MINWHNTQKNELPAHEQEVIISVNGVNYISTFDASKKIFRTNELLETFFKVDEKEILWIENQSQELNPRIKQDRTKIFKGESKKVRSDNHRTKK